MTVQNIEIKYDVSKYGNRKYDAHFKLQIILFVTDLIKVAIACFYVLNMNTFLDTISVGRLSKIAIIMLLKYILYVCVLVRNKNKTPVIIGIQVPLFRVL